MPGARGEDRMKSTLTAAILLAALCIVARIGPADAGEAIGVVQSVTGAATVTRGDRILTAAPGLRLEVGDALDTGPAGSLGVIFRDDSSLSLGPGSRLVVRNFLFSPEKGTFDLLARISRGTMAYLSGIIGKMAPGKVRFETPTATIGIRGTRFAAKVGEPSSP